MLARFQQQRDESARGELLANLGERKLLRIILRRAGCVVAGDAMESLKMLFAGLSLVCSRFFRFLGRGFRFQRRQKYGDGFRVLFCFQAVKQCRHVCRRSHCFGIGNPARHPIIVSPGADSVQGRCVHRQLRDAGVRRGALMALCTTEFDEQFAPKAKLTRLL